MRFAIDGLSGRQLRPELRDALLSSLCVHDCDAPGSRGRQRWLQLPALIKQQSGPRVLYDFFNNSPPPDGLRSCLASRLHYAV